MDPDKIFSYLDRQPAPVVSDGPLAGKTFALSRCLCVRGWPTDAGSRSLSGFTALEDATAVDRARIAGAQIIGLTHTSEMGLGLDGDKTALAPASGRCDLSLHLDIMGETRLAAAAANIYGFKPSAGIVSRYGLIGLTPSMDAIGILSRSCGDIAATLGVVAGPDGRDGLLDQSWSDTWQSYPSDHQVRRIIGLPRSLGAALEPEQLRSFEIGIEKLASAGAEIREIDLPPWDDFSLVHQIVGSVEASSSCGRYDSVRYGYRTETASNWNEMYLKSRGESFGPLLKEFLFQGAYFQFKNYAAFERAAHARARLAADWAAAADPVDFLVTPARPGSGENAPATEIGALYGQAAFTLPANLLGLPALHIPGATGGENQYSGLQLIGRRLSDYELLAFAVSLAGR